MQKHKNTKREKHAKRATKLKKITFAPAISTSYLYILYMYHAMHGI